MSTNNAFKWQSDTECQMQTQLKSSSIDFSTIKILQQDQFHLNSCHTDSNGNVLFYDQLSY